MTIETPRDRPLRTFFIVVIVIAAAFLPVAASYVKRYAVPIPSVAAIYACFLFLVSYIVAPALPGSRGMFGRFVARRSQPLIVLALLLVPYLLYAVGTGDFRWLALARLIVIAAPAIVLYSAVPVRDNARFNWQDGLIAAWLIFIVLLHQFRGIWNVPVSLDFMARLFMVSLAVFCWVYIRPIPDLGYSLKLNTAVLAAVVRNFVFFAAIAIPLGLVLGFTTWNPRWNGLPDFLLAYVEIFLFIAVLEELFFRGFIQNLLGKSLHSWWRGQLIAGSVFGLFHILHAPFPNWRYVLLASIAGWFYGSAYRAGGTLLASALLHALVDTVWRTFFTKG